MQIVAQAYYLSGDKQGCLKYIKNNFGANPGDPTLQLQMSCAYDVGDDATQRAALESLVAHTGKPEYWNNLLKLSEHAQGMRDHDTLDIYRLKLLTGTISGKDEYVTLAQLAMQLKFPAEAQAVIEKGQAAKLLNDDRSNKLLALAKSQAAADAANQAKDTGRRQCRSQGRRRWSRSVKINGVKAKPRTPSPPSRLAWPSRWTTRTMLRSAWAWPISAPARRPMPRKPFDAVKGPSDDKTVMIAHLWSLYARH